MSETAQDLFREMLRTEIGPLLRDLGFVGSRQAFRLPTPSGYALLGFQKSTTSTRESVKFTVNLRVYTEDEWDYVGSPGTEPSPNMGYLAGWEERIGNVLPARGDRWWTLTTTTRDAVVADLRSALAGASRSCPQGAGGQPPPVAPMCRSALTRRPVATVERRTA